MKAWISKALLSVALSLSVFTTGVSAEVVAERDKMIAEAAPFVKAAMSEPMQALQAETDSDEASKTLALGLAMYAGRLQTVGLSNEDVATLKAMEMRVMPLAQAYLAEHPQPKLTKAQWKRILKVSSAEMAMVDRFQKRFMADYWLSLTLKKYQVHVAAKLQRPLPPSQSTIMDPGVLVPGAAFVKREVGLKTFITACHCAAAVRKAVGLRHVRPSELPVSIRLLWEYAPDDQEAYVERQVAEGKIKGFEDLAVGAAACGDEAQFKAYVEALKASTVAPSN